MAESAFKSGFVNIIGKPNVGKSTLMNTMLGEKLSIVSPKVQTTRHRILGILTGKDHQVVFSDTPGILEPKYLLHEAMMQQVNKALEDADILLYMVEVRDHPTDHEQYLEQLLKKDTPVFLIINKVDLASQQEVMDRMDEYTQRIPEEHIIPVSALSSFNTARLMQQLLDQLPEHPPYFPGDQVTDRSERFIASEIIREKIFTRYRQEIPYSTEVTILEFVDEPEILRIHAEIIVSRKSQKPILIGKGGTALKHIGIASRKDMEAFFGKKVFLKLFVKVREDWRNKDIFLRQYGYR